MEAHDWKIQSSDLEQSTSESPEGSTYLTDRKPWIRSQRFRTYEMDHYVAVQKMGRVIKGFEHRPRRTISRGLS
jgi:hypothetical protein